MVEARLQEIRDMADRKINMLVEEYEGLEIKLQEAQTKNDNQKQSVEELKHELDSVLEEKRVLRAALEFYADHQNWLAHPGCIDDVENDEGEIAREALKQDGKL